MNIPKNKRKRKVVEKVCQFPGCDKIYYGLSFSKYCEHHRQSHFVHKLCKKRGNRWYQRVDFPDETMIIKSKTCEHRKQKCGLDGCSNTFKIYVQPSIKSYPKYCEEHRNEYKRKLFTERMNNETIL